MRLWHSAQTPTWGSPFLSSFIPSPYCSFWQWTHTCSLLRRLRNSCASLTPSFLFIIRSMAPLMPQTELSPNHQGIGPSASLLHQNILLHHILSSQPYTQCHQLPRVCLAPCLAHDVCPTKCTLCVHLWTWLLPLPLPSNGTEVLEYFIISNGVSPLGNRDGAIKFNEWQGQTY